MSQNGQLARVMGLRDLVLFHIVAIVGLRWLLTAANIGSSSMVLWLAAVLFFFIPQGLAVLELSARLPEEGGIYVWTREAFGPFHGFICGWAYWVNNLIYYPSLIVFIAANAVFVLGPQHAGLAENTFYQVIFSVVILWLAMGLNIIGLRTGRWAQNSGAIATWIAVAILVILAIGILATGKGTSPLSGGSIIPGFTASSINLWASLCFALAGLELAVVMGGEVKNPGRTLPRSILVAAPLIALIYIVGTLSILTVAPGEHVDLITGVVKSIGAAGERFGLPLTRAAAVLIVLTGLGGVGAWLAGTARIPFVVGVDRYLPPALARVHPRWKTPYVALLVQGVGATIFILVSAVGATVEEAYLVLIDTTIIVYFIPYLYLFLALPALRRRGAGGPSGPSGGGGGGGGGGATKFIIPGGVLGLRFVAVSGFMTTAAAIILASVPAGADRPAIFFLKVMGGAAGLMAVGLVFYWLAQRKRAEEAAA